MNDLVNPTACLACFILGSIVATALMVLLVAVPLRRRNQGQHEMISRNMELIEQLRDGEEMISKIGPGAKACYICGRAATGKCDNGRCAGDICEDCTCHGYCFPCARSRGVPI